MNAPEEARAAARWLKYAQEDLRAAERLEKEDYAVPRHVCWLAQQAAEKALKSALVWLRIEEAKRAVQQSRSVLNHVIDDLKKRGFPLEMSTVPEKPQQD